MASRRSWWRGVLTLATALAMFCGATYVALAAFQVVMDEPGNASVGVPVLSGSEPRMYGQTFDPADGLLPNWSPDRIGIRHGTVTAWEPSTVTVDVSLHPTSSGVPVFGNVLCTGSISPFSGSNGNVRQVDLDDCPILVGGNVYAWVVGGSEIITSGTFQLAGSNGVNTYAGGQAVRSLNEGTSWVTGTSVYSQCNPCDFGWQFSVGSEDEVVVATPVPSNVKGKANELLGFMGLTETGDRLLAALGLITIIMAAMGLKRVNPIVVVAVGFILVVIAATLEWIPAGIVIGLFVTVLAGAFLVMQMKTRSEG